MAKKIKTPKTETKEKKQRNLKRNRARGNSYECKIAKELRELGYTGVVTSRSESKAMDNMKVDLVDMENKLPIHSQIKAVIKYPNYLEIKKACPLKDKPFVLFWSIIKPTESTFRSAGEVVILEKSFFYELLKTYGKSNNHF